jgi:cardiolipin synthase A/B
MTTAAISLTIHTLLLIAVLVRVLLRPNREPASRMAWVIVVVTLPVIGIFTYLLFGEVNIGRRRIARMRAVTGSLSPEAEDAACDLSGIETTVPEHYQPLFKVGHSISGFSPVSGNRAELLADSDTAIDTMVTDIDAAREHVHLLFYIWLADNNGRKMVEALKRAAARGVKCRAMADGLGSRMMIKSEHWRAMREAGVHVAIALPVGNILLRPLVGRVDLRNHRKILVVDGRITYCGSQNCADPQFRVKPKYAPWVDAMMRFEGPVVRQNQYLFASDWMSHVHEDIRDLLQAPVATESEGFAAQVIGTGPTARFSAMPEMFESLLHAARNTLVISTPYFVPNESMMSALCAASYRGVDTTIIFPAKNDSWIVAAASRSYYAKLLEAGIKIYEYSGGLLHTKSLTMDGEVSLIGSANMDRRSFDLNYENNILFVDHRLTNALLQRQRQYLESSTRLSAQEVAGWSLSHQLWNNTVAMFGPVL